MSLVRELFLWSRWRLAVYMGIAIVTPALFLVAATIASVIFHFGGN